MNMKPPEGPGSTPVPPRHPFLLNPDAVRGADLPDLDDIEVVVVRVERPQPFWLRWAENVACHVVGYGVSGAIGVLVGRYLL